MMRRRRRRRRVLRVLTIRALHGAPRRTAPKSLIAIDKLGCLLLRPLAGPLPLHKIIRRGEAMQLDY
eukprot:6427759-Pyramimonas_sp.AAC.1